MEDDGSVVDEDVVLQSLDNGTVLMVMDKNELWQPAKQSTARHHSMAIPEQLNEIKEKLCKMRKTTQSSPTPAPAKRSDRKRKVR